MESSSPTCLDGFSLEPAQPCHYAYAMRCMEESVGASVDIQEWEQMDRWISDFRELISMTFDGAGMPNELFVLLNGEKPAGILWLGRGKDQFTCADTGYVLGIYVEGKHRGKGLGTWMLDFADRWCAEKGLETLSLNVATGNDPAGRLYSRCGFSPRSTVMRRRVTPGGASPP